MNDNDNSKSKAERDRRANDMREAWASCQLEGLPPPSEFARRIAQKYIDGEIDIKEHIKLLREHHGLKEGGQNG